MTNSLCHPFALAATARRNMARSAGDDDPAGRAQAARFEAEVEKKAKALLKANRKLARDVSQWVNTSMTRHEEASAFAAGGSENDSRLHANGERGGVDLGSSPTRQQTAEQGDESDDAGVEERKEFDREDAAARYDSSGYGGGARSWLRGWLG